MNSNVQDKTVVELVLDAMASGESGSSIFGQAFSECIVLDLQFDMMSDQLRSHKEERGLDDAYLIMAAQLATLKQFDAMGKVILNELHHDVASAAEYAQMLPRLIQRNDFLKDSCYALNETMSEGQRMFLVLLHMNLKNIQYEVLYALKKAV